MKKTNLKHRIIISAAAFVSVCIIGCEVPNVKVNVKDKKTAVEKKPITKEELVQRGKYLVKIAGCGDCHSPKNVGENGIPFEDPNYLLSGHPEGLAIENFDKKTAKNFVLFNMHNTAAVGPWGVSFAANITSDPTGIGNWSEENFIIAMTEGKFKGMKAGRSLLPPMPWPNYAQMEVEDLKAIFAYLQSTTPVKNVVPAAIPPTNL